MREDVQDFFAMIKQDIFVRMGHGFLALHDFFKCSFLVQDVFFLINDLLEFFGICPTPSPDRD